MTEEHRADQHRADQHEADQHRADEHRPDDVIDGWARPIGAAVTAALTLALLALAGFYVYELGSGASDNPLRVVMSIALFLLFAGAGAAMTRAWLLGLSWTATPTLVICALLLPTAWSFLQAEQWMVAVVLAVVAVVGIWVGWKGRSARE